MNLNDLSKIINLIDQLNSSVVDNNVKSKNLVHELLEMFPKYEINCVAYRAIKGDWENGFDNLFWSKSIEGSRIAYKTMYSKYSKMKIFRANIKGFDVFQFYTDIQAIPFFKNNLNFAYHDEEEVLAIEYSNVVAVDLDEDFYKIA